MAYIALYRKWRPKTFRDLVGQEHVSKTLTEAIETGRVGHAYLFSGPRGTGKTSTAKILARALNCEKGPTPEPCGVCENCRKIADGSSMDVFEIDAASNRGIDEIRGLRETVKFAPTEGRYKVYIIDEVHMLTAEAFNALLKTLEEPPPRVVFILATTEAHKVPATIQSRCQRYDFRRITPEEIEARLAYIVEHTRFDVAPEAASADEAEAGGQDEASGTPVTAEDGALTLIALAADGGLRDALSILDQCISLSGGKVTTEIVQDMLGLVGHAAIYQLTEALAAKDAQKTLLTLAELLRDGRDLRQIVAELSLHLRSLMIYQAAGTVEGLDLYAEPTDVLEKQKDFFPSDVTMAILRRLAEAQGEIKWSPQPRVSVEAALLAIISGDFSRTDRLLFAAPATATQGTAAAMPQATPQSLAAGDQRLAALEQKLQSLTAALEAQKNAAPLAAPNLAQSAAPRQAQTVTSAAPRTGQATYGQSASRSFAPATPSAAAPSPEDAAIWQQICASFESGHRGATRAILQVATFEGFQGDECHLSFANPMLAQVALGDSNRPYIEAALAAVFGHPMRLVCTSADMPRPVPPAPKRREKPKLPPLPHAPKPIEIDIDKEDLTEEEKENLRRSKKIIGGHFIEPPDEPREEISGNAAETSQAGKPESSAEKPPTEKSASNAGAQEKAPEAQAAPAPEADLADIPFPDDADAPPEEDEGEEELPDEER